MALQSGTRLGRYEIVGPLGAGGMGEVYRARDTKLQREIAIKILPERLAGSPEKRERFEREARAVAQLSHPNILAIHDFGTDQGISYAVTELLEGETLRERLKRGPLSPREAVAIVAAVADGLAAAHAKGITHRDLKPENIFLTADGQVKILDFGLALVEVVPSSEAETEKRTDPGTVLGTVGYMSPEQVRGERVDGRSDLFSLGGVLYEMLTGRRAFAKETVAETMTAILKEEPPELEESGADISPALARVVAHCLEKPPEQRFQSAKDLAFALREMSTDKVPPGPSRAPGRAWYRYTLGLAAGVTVLLVAAVFFFGMRGEPAQPGSGIDPDRVVVAVFENQTGDETLDSLGRMAADWITQGLSQTGVVNVVPASSASMHSAATIQELAERTGAGTVVSGAYYLAGDAVQFRAEITDVETEEILHSLDPISGSRGAPMDVIEELRQQVMGALATHFSLPDADLRTLTRPPSFDAYQEYIAGMELFGGDYPRAIQHFERAIELDPDFLRPRLLLAVSYSNQGEYEKAESIAEVLLENREQLIPFERYYLDWYAARLLGRYVEAQQSLRQAEKLDPTNYQMGYLIGLNAIRMNRLQEAIDAFEQSKRAFTEVEAGAWRTWLWSNVAQAHHMLGNYQQELTEVRQARTLFPGASLYRAEVRAFAAMGQIEEVNRVIDEASSRMANPGGIMLEAAEELRAHGHREASREVLNRAVGWYRSRPPDEAASEDHHFNLARALYLAEHWEEAGTIFEELATEYPDNISYKGYLGALAARRGDGEAALRISAELQSIDRPYLFGEHTYWRACIAALVGERDQAVDLLREAYAQGREYDVDLHRDINLESLRDYAPFQELLRPKG